MTRRLRAAWKDDAKVKRFEATVSVLILLAILLTFASQVYFANKETQRLEALQEGTAQIGYVARQQQRCVSWESQVTLLHILLANPHLTPAQVKEIHDLIPLPSLRVRNGDGHVFTLNCDMIVRQAVPGLPEGLSIPPPLATQEPGRSP